MANSRFDAEDVPRSTSGRRAQHVRTDGSDSVLVGGPSRGSCVSFHDCLLMTRRGNVSHAALTQVSHRLRVPVKAGFPQLEYI